MAMIFISIITIENSKRPHTETQIMVSLDRVIGIRGLESVMKAIKETGDHLIESDHVQDQGPTLGISKRIIEEDHHHHHTMQPIHNHQKSTPKTKMIIKGRFLERNPKKEVKFKSNK